MLSTSTWIGGADTDSVDTSGNPNAWSNPLNWLGGVPSVGDTAEFTDNVSFSLPNHTPGQPPVTFQHPFNESPNDDVNASVVISIDSSWDGNITVENGIILTLTGSGTWNGGTLTTASGGTLINSSTATLTLQNTSGVAISGTFTNQGIINEDGSAPIQMVGGTLDNESGASFDIQSNQAFTFDDSTADIFNNSGLLEQTGGTGTTDFSSDLSNTGGTIDVQTGTLSAWTDGGGATLTGTLDNSSTGTITFEDSGNTVGFLGGGTINNTASGVIDIDGIDAGLPLVDTTVNNSGTINSNSPSSVSISTVNNAGIVNVESGTLNADNVTQVSSKTLTGGTWNVSGGSTLNLQNGTALTTNNAAVLLDGAGSSIANFANELATNGGSFTVQDGATFTTPGALSNTGAVVIGNNGSILTTTGNYNQSGTGSLTNLQGGTLKPLTSTTMITGGSVVGSGTIQGNVTNAAVFDPGTPTTGGTITITGNYTQTAAGALDIGLGGAASGQFGQLAVTGTASLNGPLNLTLLTGFVPTDTESFTALTYGTHSGTFPTVTGTSIPDNETLTTDYTGVDLIVGVAGTSSSHPTSTVNALPAVTTTTSFTVSWSGSLGRAPRASLLSRYLSRRMAAPSRRS